MAARSRIGIVVLANSEVGVDDIALHLVDPQRPLDKPVKQGQDIASDAKGRGGDLPATRVE
jgi:hypothetical protein